LARGGMERHKLKGDRNLNSPANRSGTSTRGAKKSVPMYPGEGEKRLGRDLTEVSKERGQGHLRPGTANRARDTTKRSTISAARKIKKREIQGSPVLYKESMELRKHSQFGTRRAQGEHDCEEKTTEGPLLLVNSEQDRVRAVKKSELSENQVIRTNLRTPQDKKPAGTIKGKEIEPRPAEC